MSNRDGIGARLEMVAGGRRQVRRIRRNASYLSTFEKTATFGLAAAPRVDSLLVFWPSGIVDRLSNLPANRTVRVVEGQGEEGGGKGKTGSQAETGVQR